MPPAPPAARRALVIVNARAGGGRDASVAQDLRGQFAAAGLQAEVALLQDGDDIASLVARARAEGLGLVVAGGGDGTQGAVAAQLAGTGIVQGVLPLGTLNHFARDLGVPLALDDAIRTIAQGRVLQVDVGEVNGHVFINNSSLGLYPEIVRERELQQQRLGKGKWRSLASATLHALERHAGLAVRVDAEEGDAQLHRTPFVFVGNNRYGMEGFRIGARASLQGGELALYIARRRGRLGLLVLAWRALLRRLQQDVDFELLTGGAFVVSTRHARIRVATDGEVAMMDSPLHYRIRPGALRVLVPAAQPQAPTAP
jgi:diacylglycerol kinase family enzyme